MATYVFDCKDCGESFEVNMPMHDHDDPNKRRPPCPKCGSQKTQQVVSTFSSKPASASF
jgi:putative FmdB family regulatory protein